MTKEFRALFHGQVIANMVTNALPERLPSHRLSLVRIAPLGVHTHRHGIFSPYRFRLAVLPREAGGAPLEIGILAPLLGRDAIALNLGRRNRQGNIFGDFRIADDAYWVFAA